MSCRDTRRNEEYDLTCVPPGRASPFVLQGETNNQSIISASLKAKTFPMEEVVEVVGVFITRDFLLDSFSSWLFIVFLYILNQVGSKNLNSLP